MRVDFAMGGIDDQPLKIRIINQCCKNFFPNPIVPPTAKTTMNIAPVAIIRGNVPHRSARPKPPQNTVNKQSIILRNTTPRTFSARQKRL
jgi:uncharacterized protein YchJ